MKNLFLAISFIAMSGCGWVDSTGVQAGDEINAAPEEPMIPVPTIKEPIVIAPEIVSPPVVILPPTVVVPTPAPDLFNFVNLPPDSDSAEKTQELCMADYIRINNTKYGNSNGNNPEIVFVHKKDITVRWDHNNSQSPGIHREATTATGAVFAPKGNDCNVTMFEEFRNSEKLRYFYEGKKLCEVDEGEYNKDDDDYLGKQEIYLVVDPVSGQAPATYGLIKTLEFYRFGNRALEIDPGFELVVQDNKVKTLCEQSARVIL